MAKTFCVQVGARRPRRADRRGKTPGARRGHLGTAPGDPERTSIFNALMAIRRELCPRRALGVGSRRSRS